MIYDGGLNIDNKRVSVEKAPTLCTHISLYAFAMGASAIVYMLSGGIAANK